MTPARGTFVVSTGLGSGADADLPRAPGSATGGPSPGTDRAPAAFPRPHLAAALLGVAGLAAAFVVARPTGLPGLEVAATLTRWVLYSATLLAAGGSLFLVALHDGAGAVGERRTLRRWIRIPAWAGVAAGVGTLALQTAAAAGQGVAGVVDPGTVLTVGSGPEGMATGMRVIGLLLVVVATYRLRSRISATAALGGAIVALASFVLVGHSATAEPRLLVATSTLVHLAAAAGWFGGLVLLLATLRHRRAGGDVTGGVAIVARFSTFAAASVTALLASGVAMSASVLTGPGELLTTDYGRTLASKAGLVAAVLLAAAYNHRRVVPRLRVRADDAWRLLTTATAIEVAGLLVVMLATSLLVGLATPG